SKPRVARSVASAACSTTPLPKSLARREPCEERPVGNDIAETQRGEEHLGEGACIDDLAGRVPRLERGQCRTRVAQLAVVVVLQDRDLVFVREREERASPCRAHPGPRGTLGGRRDVDE